MARVEDAREAEEMVRSYFRERDKLGPKPSGFETRKQGFTWIVTFRCGVMGTDKGEVRVNGRTGKMGKIKIK